MSLVLLLGCGLIDRGGAPESGEGPSADTTTVTPSAIDTLPAPSTDTAVSIQTPPPVAAPTPQAVDTLAVLAARLDSVLAGQRGLALRLDSIASAGQAASLPTPATTAAPDTSNALDQGSQVLGEAGRSVQSFGIRAIMSVIVIVLFNLLIRGSVWLLDALSERNPRRRLFYKRLVPIVRIVLWIFAAYLIVRVIFRIDAQGIFAAAAAIGVAVGFAAQDLLKNLFGGIILVFDQPFQVGDKISVGSTYGEVVSIGLRSTRIVTPDDNLVSVPNAQVVDQQVANANAGELNCQVVTDLYLPGWADERAAKRIAFEAAAGSKYVYLNKPIVVMVADVFKETFLTRVRVKAYVLDPRLEFLFQSDITERARAGFREAGLLRPEHQQTWLVDQAGFGTGMYASSAATAPTAPTTSDASTTPATADTPSTPATADTPSRSTSDRTEAEQ